jgi:hypothetical protein
MSLEVCLCVPAGDEFVQYAFRFLSSYLSFPAQLEHQLTLLTDAGNEEQAEDLFAIVPGVRAMATPSHAKDLSRYEYHCRQSGSDCVMYLGGTSYCRRAGWGLRAYRAFQTMGSNNQYGACGHTGMGVVRPHLRSTGIWGSPLLFRRYPGWPKDSAGRYAAEHSGGCLSDWVRAQGGNNWVISFNGEWPLERANDDAQGYGRGNHASLLMGDRLTMAPYAPFP